MAGVQGECLLETQAAILDKFLQKFMRIPKKEEQEGMKQEEEEEEQEEEEDDKGEMAGMSESQSAERCRCSVGGWTNPLSGGSYSTFSSQRLVSLCCLQPGPYQCFREK